MTGPVIAVAWQSRFVDGKWSECSREHVEWVRSVPHEWPGYEVRELYAAPQPAPAIDLEQGLRDLYRAYVRLLESGRDRITSLGGGCDPVDVMERSDIDLRKVRDLLALIDGQTNVRSSSEQCSEAVRKGEGE